MAYSHAIFLLVGLTYLTNITLAGKLTEDKVSDLNAVFQASLQAKIGATEAVFQNTNGIALFTDVNETALRLYGEGMVTGWVTLNESPVRNDELGQKRSLLISGYGGKGAAGLAVAKVRAEAGEYVTLLLLPFATGGRGRRGAIDTNASAQYEKLEAWLRDWNTTKGENRITFVSIMDKDSTLPAFAAARNIISEANTELQAYYKLKGDMKTALENAKGNEEDAEYLTAKDALGKHARKYYTKEGVPESALEAVIVSIMNAVLEELGKVLYDYCFEAHSGQGFRTDSGKLFSALIIQFLIDLKSNGVYLISTDYQLGTTNLGLQKIILPNYKPDLMIVIFLLPSIVVRDVDGEFEQRDVKIVQIDWNTACERLFGNSVPQGLKYTVAPDSISKPETSVSKANFDTIKYRVLESMVDHKQQWEVAAAAA